MLLKWTGAKQEETGGNPVEESAVSVTENRGSGIALVMTLATILWFAAAFFYLDTSAGLSSILFMLPHEQALILIALVLPPTLGWLIALVLRKNVEGVRSRQALLEVLADISGPDREAEARLNATAMALRRISQTVESELGNALARADGLNERIDAGLSRLGELSEGAGRQSELAGELIERASGAQGKLLEELQSLGERTRSLSRTEATELTAAVESAARRADEIAVLLDAKVRTVSETVENASRRAGELGAAIDQPMSRMREESEQTVRRISTASQELKGRVEALSQEMSKTADQAGEASRGVDASAVRLRQATGEMRGLLAGTGEEVRQRITELHELVTGTMRSSEQAAQRMDQRLGDLAGALDGFNVSAGETEEAVAASIERVTGAVGAFADHAATVQETANETAARTETAAAGVLEASTSFSAASRQLDTASQKLNVSRDEVAATVTHLSGVIEETVSALEERIREVSSFAEGASERSGEKLQVVAIQIADAARGLGRQIALIEEQARGGEGQAAASADVLAVRLAELKSVLSEITSESERSTDGMRRLAENSGQLLDNLAAHASGLGEQIERTTSAAEQSANAVTASISKVSEASTESEAKLGGLANALTVHAGGLDAVANRLTASAATIETRAAERLSEVAAQVDDLTRSADDRLTGVARKLQNLFMDLQERSGEMTSAVEAASGRSESAGARFSEAMAELSLLLQEVDQSVTDAGNSFGKLDERVRGVAEAIRGGVEDNLVLMEDRGRQVTGRLFEAAEELSAASEELERRSDFSLQQLSELRGRTAGELNEVEGRLGALTEMWRDRADLFEKAANGLEQAASRLDGETSGRLVSFTARMSEAVAEARSTVDGLEAERIRLLETGRETEERLGGVTSEMELRLAAVSDRARQGAAGIREEVDRLQERVADLRTVSDEVSGEVAGDASRVDAVMAELQAMVHGLKTEVTTLVETSQGAALTLQTSGESVRSGGEQMRLDLTASAQSLADEGGRVAGVLRQLKEELDSADVGMTGRIAGLEQSVRNATEMAQLTSDALLAGTEAMIAESGRVREEMSQAGQSLITQAEAIGTAGEAVTGRIAGSVGELEIRAEGLNAAGNAVEADVMARAEAVARRMQELNDVSAESRTAWEDGARSVELAARTSEAHSKSAIATLNETAQLLDASLPQIASLDASATALRTQGQSLVRAIAELEEKSAGTLSSLSDRRQQLTRDNASISAEMSAGLERLSAGIEEARARMSSFAATEKSVAELVEKTTSHVDAQLTRSRLLAATMEERGASLDALLKGRIEAVESAERSAAEAAELLAESITREQERLATMRDVAMSDAEAFAGNITSTLDDLTGRAAGFSDRIAELNQATERLQAELASSSERVGEDAAAAIETRERIAEAADRSSRKLAEQREAFALSAEEADKATERARRMLSEQATAIASASKAATMQAGMAARSFEEQASRLEGAARQAAETSTRMEDAYQGSGDRRFLSAAGEVAGALNSMALDLHRLLDAEGTESQWQRYVSGDRGIFTRRLVNRTNRKQISRAYNADGDFRRHVDSYIGEFEAVLDKAQSADHDGLLTGIFMSADVGKLYLVLCDSLDRKPVTSAKRKKK